MMMMKSHLFRLAFTTYPLSDDWVCTRVSKDTAPVHISPCSLNVYSLYYFVTRYKHITTC